MAWIETRQTEPGRDEARSIQPLREAITRAAALGFLTGGMVRLALGGVIDPPPPMLWALYLPVGAVAAAVAAGVVLNLILVPLLCRTMPGNRLPDAAYRAAGALAALASFAVAFEIPPAGP